MSDSPYIVDVDLEAFQTLVIDNSYHAPVLVDFWADWCNPCKSLMPVLASITEEFHGQVLLAKVNSDQQQELVARYGVRSLPTVKLFRNGEVVDEFSGAQPESVIRRMLEPYLTRASDETAMQAIAAYDRGEVEQALALLASVYESDPANTKAMILYGKLLAEQGQPEQALAVLRQLPSEQQQDGDIRALMLQLEFGASSAEQPDLTQLQADLAANPQDHATRYTLANLHIAHGEYEAGMELLMEILRNDANFKDGIAKQTLLKVFDMLGGSGPLVSRYRSKLYNLLY